MIITFKTWSRALTIALFLICLLFSLTILSRQTVRYIVVGEYSIVESLSALSYLFAFIIALITEKKAQSWLKFYMLIGAIATFVFFGEETSWLQHYLNYNTPEWFVDNSAQQEFNIHNLIHFQGGSVLANFDSEFDYLLLLKFQNIFQLGFFGYFLIFPLSIYLFKRLSITFDFCKIPFFGIQCIAAFFIPIIFSIILTVIYEESSLIKSAIAETREYIYSLAIVIFFFLVRRDINRALETPE
jgi:hypothetical protein